MLPSRLISHRFGSSRGTVSLDFRSSNLGMTGIGRRDDRTIPLQNQLGNWLVRRYDVYTCAPSPPASLRNKQQDGRQYSH
jgi:hypothetical protein